LDYSTLMASSPPQEVSSHELRQRAAACAILIVAAGFEDRATHIARILSHQVTGRVCLIAYAAGEPANDANYSAMSSELGRSQSLGGLREVQLDPTRPDDFLSALARILLEWRPDATGEIWIDISALPMQAICATLAAVRESLPALSVRILYTEAREYFPTKAEIRSKQHSSLQSLSKEMSGNLIPKHFGGSSSEQATCLILFAGYEKHRSIGAVDELNPAKLVLAFGKPRLADLAWRERWSRTLHQDIADSRPTAVEVVSTFNVGSVMQLVEQYYGFLFGDHNIALAPLCSKFQCVACYLMWERFRDIQLVFPLPVSYVPQRFSTGCARIFEYSLPFRTQLSSPTPAATQTPPPLVID